MENEPRPFYRGGKGPRYDIRNEAVQDLLDSGISVGDISRKLDCSAALIVQIKLGIRRDQKRSQRMNLKGRKVCTCCGVRPRKRGNRFLCEICFRSGSNGEIAADSIHCYASI